MQSRTAHTAFRLWHERSMQTVTFCDCFNRQSGCHDPVSSPQRFVIAKIDLMLRRSLFMMGSFHYISHIFQCQDHITSGILSEIYRSDIEISGIFMSHSSRPSLVVRMEQEKFTLRSHVKPVSHFLCLRKYLL